MRLVLIESPYRGTGLDDDIALNLSYAQDAMRDCLERGEAPFASHLLYPQILNDNLLAERGLGIKAGLAWGKRADATVVYQDLWFSHGMMLGIRDAKDENRPVEYRSLEKWRK